MASPQLEKGYLQIANELFERLYQACLPGREHRAMGFILRVTYGYKRKAAEVSSVDLGQQIDCDPSEARKILNRLVSRNMLFRVAEHRGIKPAVFQINKNWETWEHDRTTPWPPLRLPVSRGLDHPTKRAFPDENPPTNRGKTPRLDGGSTPRQKVQNPPTTCQNHPESIATLDALKKEESKTCNTTPLTPQGELGGSRTGKKNADSAKDQNPKFLQMISWLEGKLGHPPAGHLAERTWAIVNRRTPAGWPPLNWRQNCVETFERCLDEAIFDLSAGKRIHSVLATANSRAEQAIALEAKASGQ